MEGEFFMAISPRNREAVIEFGKSNKNSLHYSKSGGNYAALSNMTYVLRWILLRVSGFGTH